MAATRTCRGIGEISSPLRQQPHISSPTNGTSPLKLKDAYSRRLLRVLVRLRKRCLQAGATCVDLYAIGNPFGDVEKYKSQKCRLKRRSLYKKRRPLLKIVQWIYDLVPAVVIRKSQEVS